MFPNYGDSCTDWLEKKKKTFCYSPFHFFFDDNNIYINYPIVFKKTKINKIHSNCIKRVQSFKKNPFELNKTNTIFYKIQTKKIFTLKISSLNN